MIESHTLGPGHSVDLDLHGYGHGEARVDGRLVENLTGIDIKLRVGAPTEVTIHRIADHVAGRVRT